MGLKHLRSELLCEFSVLDYQCWLPLEGGAKKYHNCFEIWVIVGE